MKKSFTLINIKKKQLIVTVFLLLVVSVCASWAQTAIFNPSMSITPYGNVRSPNNETYQGSIDPCLI